MASKISLAFLITVTTVLLIASFFLVRKYKSTTESFTAPYSVQNLSINTCPTFASEIQTAKGTTDCCSGDLIDGKCNGNTFCTKSPEHDGVPTCLVAWRDYFTKKGQEVCPASMPNYFENIKNNTAPKGCSAGPIYEDGMLPKDGTAKQCKIYAEEKDNLFKIDSCAVEKLRASVQCPAVNGFSPSATLYINPTQPDTFIVILCEYPLEPNMPTFCADKKSLENYFDSIFPNWRNYQRWVDDVKNISCDNYLTLRSQSRSQSS